jgi:hypothetical protein
MLSGIIILLYPCYPAVSPLALMLYGSFTPGIHAIRQYDPLVFMLFGNIIPWYSCCPAVLSPGIHAIGWYYPLVSMLSGSIIPWYPCYIAVLYYRLVSTLSGSIIPWFPCYPGVLWSPGSHAIWQYYPLVSPPLLQNIPNYPHNSAPSRKCCLVWAIKSFFPLPSPPPLGHRVWPTAQSLLSPYQEFAKLVSKIYSSTLYLPKFRKISVFPPLSCALFLSNYNEWLHQGVTKRRRLSWLTNSALVYESKCGGEGGVAGNQLCTWSTNNFWDLTPYLTYGLHEWNIEEENNGYVVFTSTDEMGNRGVVGGEMLLCPPPTLSTNF